MKFKNFQILLGVMAFLGFWSCSPRLEIQKAPVKLVWPKPPNIPSIRWLKSFSSPQELGIKKSLFGKVHKIITGKEDENYRLISPFNVVKGGRGKLYVTDTFFRSVHVFEQDKNRYWQISGTESAPLQSPIGVAVDRRERIFVSDSVLQRISVFDDSGKLIFSIQDGGFLRPTGIALNNDLQKLYVVDTLDHKIKIFDTDGKFLGAFGSQGKEPGEFNFPTCLAIDKQNRVYIGDTMNFRIQVFSAQGQYITGFGELGDGSGYFSQIKGLAVDSQGHIYVTDAQFDVVQVFDIDGNFLLSFGSSGSSPGEFSLPAGIFIDDLDNIYIVDRLNQRVQLFKYIREEQ